jgi:hypothetical protein
MTTKQFFWKIWLRLNPLSKNANNDYIAEISTTGNTRHNADIARQIVKGRSELRYETILSILNERDAVVRDLVLNGSSVQDNNIRLTPRITGNWVGSNPVFDQDEHKITVDAIPTAEFRKALEEEVGVEIFGKKVDGGAFIGLVKDLRTGKTDGTVSPSGDIIITGKKIKIAPADDASLGVFFVDDSNTETPLDYPLAENNPKKILCRIPANLANGVYTLKIVTCYSNSSTLLASSRAIVYDLPLKIVVPDI